MAKSPLHLEFIKTGLQPSLQLSDRSNFKQIEVILNFKQRLTLLRSGEGGVFPDCGDCLTSGLAVGKTDDIC